MQDGVVPGGFTVEHGDGSRETYATAHDADHAILGRRSAESARDIGKVALACCALAALEAVHLLAHALGVW